MQYHCTPSLRSVFIWIRMNSKVVAGLKWPFPGHYIPLPFRHEDRQCFLVIKREFIVRCMGLSYEESVRISMKWLSFRRRLFTLTSCSRRIIWMSSTSWFLAWLSFFEGGSEMSINRRKGIRNIKKGKISLKIDGVICWWHPVSGMCRVRFGRIHNRGI